MKKWNAAIGAIAALILTLGVAGCHDATWDGDGLEKKIEQLDPSPIAQAGAPGVTAVAISAFMDESVTLALTVDPEQFDAASLCQVLDKYVAVAPSWSTVVRVGAVDTTRTIVDFEPFAAGLGLDYSETLRGVSAPWSQVVQATDACP